MSALKFKLKRIDIICVLLFFSIVKIYAVPQIVQQIMKIVFLAIVLLFLLYKSVGKMWNEGLLLATVLTIPSFIGFFCGDLNIKIFLEGILNAVVIYSMYTFLQYVAEHNLLKRTLDVLFYLASVTCFISLISVLRQGRAAYETGTDYKYFFGNKFATMYLFIFLVGLAYVKFYSGQKRKVKRRLILLSLIVLEIFLSYWVRCSTTMIGGIVMFFTIMFSGKRTEWIRKLMSNPVISVIYLIFPGFLALNMASIIQIPSIRQFITDRLGKSVSLTGRVYIYSTLMNTFTQKPIFGYGYNSNIVNQLTEIGSAQNGLFQLLIEFGVVGVVMVSIIVYKSFLSSRDINELWGIKVFVFAMCICSIVETSFNYLFFLGLFILKFGYAYNPAYILSPSIKKRIKLSM